jgi:hypothetical protein
MSKLEYLDLGFNGLQHLDRDVFSGLVNINDIYLEGNKLQYLHPDTFLGLPNIERIILRSNSDLLIPTDRNFITSHSLLHLFISSCNISSVSVETFTNVSALELLDLSYNNVRTVDVNILTALPKLSKFYLYGNRLQCDCQLLEVLRWCEDHGIQTGSGECGTPSEVEGRRWGVLEKGQLLEGNIQHYVHCNNTNYTDGGDTDTETKTDMDTEGKYMDTGTQTATVPMYQVLVQ